MVKNWRFGTGLCLALIVVLHCPVIAAETTSSSLVKSSSLPSTAVPTAKDTKKFTNLHKEHLERIKSGKPIDLLFLGDSITARWTEAPDIWNESFGKWNPANFGIGGDRTENVIWRITNGALDGIDPKVIVLMIGTNNTHQSQPAEIVQGIKKILEIIDQKLPNTQVLLLGVFPRGARLKDGKLQTRPVERVRAINKELPELARDGKVRYLDITKDFLVDGEVPESIMPDKVHLSVQGYQIWAKAITPVLDEMMK